MFKCLSAKESRLRHNDLACRNTRTADERGTRHETNDNSSHRLPIVPSLAFGDPSAARIAALLTWNGDSEEEAKANVPSRMSICLAETSISQSFQILQECIKSHAPVVEEKKHAANNFVS